MLHDLLVRRYHDEHMHRLLHPAEDAVERLAANPEAAREELDKVKRETMGNAGVQRALQRLGIGAKQEPPRPPSELKLTVRPGASSHKKVTP